MAVMWNAFEPAGLAEASLLLLNTFLFWLGVTLTAHSLWHLGSRKWAFALLLSGLSPFLIFENRFIITDVGLSSSLIAFFGITFWYKCRQRSVSFAGWLALFVIGTYALLVRTNASFAVVPLVLYALGIEAAARTKLWTLLVVVISLCAVPVSSLVNRELLGATDNGAFERLPIYDIAGVAHFTGDWSRLPPARSYPAGSLSHCYTPLLWDTLMMPRCHDLWDKLPPPGSPTRRQIFREWLFAVTHHPFAYAAHRLLQFNSEIFFLVPPAHQCVAAPEMHACGTASSTERTKVVRNDYLLKNALVWPVTWITIGLVLTIFTWKSDAPQIKGARALLVSALLYALAYLIVGLATNVRYFLWTELAVQIALLMVLAGIEPEPRTRLLKWIAFPVLSVTALGYIFRLFEINWFV